MKTKPLLIADVKKIDQTVTGWMTVNGRKVSSKIQTIFQVCSDTVSPWRQDARERFLELMADAGLEKEGTAIISALKD